MKIPIVGGSNQEWSVNFNSQRCVNLFPVVDPLGSKSGGALYGTPGTELFVTMPELPVRGLLAAQSGLIYVVSGASFYQLDYNGDITNLGAVSNEFTDVAMYEGVNQVMIITESAGYIYTKDTATLTQITDVDFAPGGELTLLNGYFVYTEPNTDRFWITGYNDGSTIDALEFGVANVDSDNLITVINLRQELWLFGERTTEVWTYDANVDFPFSRIDGATLDVGCAAKKSVAKANGSAIWLSSNRRGKGQVMASSGYNAQVISTQAIDYAIGQLDVISDAVAYTYQEDGHTFYAITFPSGDLTLVFDFTTGMWHQRGWADKYGIMHRQRQQFYAYVRDTHYCSDHEFGNIYKVSRDYLSEYNCIPTPEWPDDIYPITRLRTFQHANGEADRIYWKKLQIDMEVGVGLEANEEPVIELRWSDDGGHAFSNSHIGSFGKIGEYRKRVIWRRLGKSRDRVYEIRIAEPVKIAIIDCYAETEAASG